jgi:hypothetical protein
MRNTSMLRNGLYEFYAVFRLHLFSNCIVTFVLCLWRALLLAASNAREMDGLSLLALPPPASRARPQIRGVLPPSPAYILCRSITELSVAL